MSKSYLKASLQNNAKNKPIDIMYANLADVGLQQ